MPDPMRFTDMGFPHPRDQRPEDFTASGDFMVGARQYLDSDPEERQLPDFMSMADPTNPEDMRKVIGSFQQLGFEYGGKGEIEPFIKGAQDAYSSAFSDDTEKEAINSAMRQAFTNGQQKRIQLLLSGKDINDPMAGQGPPPMTGEGGAPPPPTPTPPTGTLSPEFEGGTTGGAHMEQALAALEQQKQDKLTVAVETGQLTEAQAREQGWRGLGETPNF